MRSSMGLMLCAVLAMTACGDDDDGVERRGSPACQDFQDAFCDFGADQCGQIARGTCDAMLSGIECTSDALASECANNLSASTCGQPVRNCDLFQIVDRAPATAKCNQFVAAACKRFADCGQIPDMSACQAAVAMMGVDCSTALGVGAAFEDCVQQIGAAKCPFQQLPGVCRGVVVVLPPGVLGVTPGTGMTATP